LVEAKPSLLSGDPSDFCDPVLSPVLSPNLASRGNAAARAPSKRQRYASSVTEEPGAPPGANETPEGPEERLFRSRQHWTVYGIFVVGLLWLIVAVILATR
jgi:hypothetical protein